jgi:hypothetical protein
MIRLGRLYARKLDRHPTRTLVRELDRPVRKKAKRQPLSWKRLSTKFPERRKADAPTFLEQSSLSLKLVVVYWERLGLSLMLLCNTETPSYALKYRNRLGETQMESPALKHLEPACFLVAQTQAFGKSALSHLQSTLGRIPLHAQTSGF